MTCRTTSRRSNASSSIRRNSPFTSISDEKRLLECCQCGSVAVTAPKVKRGRPFCIMHNECSNVRMFECLNGGLEGLEGLGGLEFGVGRLEFRV